MVISVGLPASQHGDWAAPSIPGDGEVPIQRLEYLTLETQRAAVVRPEADAALAVLRTAEVTRVDHLLMDAVAGDVRQRCPAYLLHDEPGGLRLGHDPFELRNQVLVPWLVPVGFHHVDKLAEGLAGRTTDYAVEPPARRMKALHVPTP